MKIENSNVQATSESLPLVNTVLGDAYFFRRILNFIIGYFVHTPCFIIHELCHIFAIFIFYPMVKVNSIDYSINYFDSYLIINFWSDYKFVRILITIAPLLFSSTIYMFFLVTQRPIFAIIILILINYSKLGLSKIDKETFLNEI
jgi:hypothetical protein